MRRAQQSLAGFLPLIDWNQFRRRNLSEELIVSEDSVLRFGCGDDRQALLWLLRSDTVTRGIVPNDAEPITATVTIPHIAEGRYGVSFYDTHVGKIVNELDLAATGGLLILPEVRIQSDVGVAVRPRN
jgi:mannan endo-1,4-beta-mannosidase